MKKATTPSFIIELPLTMRQVDEREALIRLEFARRLRNACQGEALRRLDLMRQSKAWQKACAMPKGEPRSPQRKKRNTEFKRLNHQYRFTSAAISAFGTQCKNAAHWQDRLGAHETQRIAEIAFKAAEEHALGKRGRPRFKGRHRPLHSMEGKSAGSGLRWKRELGAIEWGGLVLRARLPADSKDAYLAEAMQHRTKYARVLWRNIDGRRRWFAQLVQEGLPPRKYKTIEGAIVGMDVGPSTVGVCADSAVALLPLCPEVEQPWKAMRRIQRAMDRSRRATNPECYDANSTFKKGARVKVRSGNYQALCLDLAETERILAERRKRSHGNLANRILALGNVIQTEKLSYVAFQKCFGRSAKVRAVGALMSHLQRKAESAGGALVDLDTWRLKLSQYDHVTRACTKKPLKQRWHALGDGSGYVQRDLYSAFLAMNVASGAIHSRQAETTWPAAQSLLVRAGWMQNQPSSVESLLKTAPSLPAPEKVARKRKSAIGHARDAVAEKREPASPYGN